VLWAAALHDDSLFHRPAAAAPASSSAGGQIVLPAASPEEEEVINDLTHMYSLWFSAGMLRPSALPDCPDCAHILWANPGLVFCYQHQISVLLPTALLYWAAHTQEVPGRSLQVDIQEVLRLAAKAGVRTTKVLECESETLSRLLTPQEAVQCEAVAIHAAEELLPLVAAVGNRVLHHLGPVPSSSSSSSNSVLLGRKPAVVRPGGVLLLLASGSSNSSSADSTLDRIGLTAADLRSVLQSISRFGGTRFSEILRALRAARSSSTATPGGSVKAASSPTDGCSTATAAAAARAAAAAAVARAAAAAAAAAGLIPPVVAAAAAAMLVMVLTAAVAVAAAAAAALQPTGVLLTGSLTA